MQRHHEGKQQRPGRGPCIASFRVDQHACVEQVVDKDQSFGVEQGVDHQVIPKYHSDSRSSNRSESATNLSTDLRADLDTARSKI